MNSDRRTSRLLGVTFLIVIFTSALGGMLFDATVGSGDISDVLVNISNKPTQMRVSILADMFNSLGIAALAALLYVVLSKHNRVAALIALGWWLAEAISYALSRIGAFALIPLSLDFVQAGAPDHSFYQTLGEFLYHGVARQGSTIHMFFYCAGGIVWYYLFYRSRVVPRAISLFGLLAASVGLVGILFAFFGYDVPIVVYLPILPFELAIGLWLMLKGARNHGQGP